MRSIPTAWHSQQSTNKEEQKLNIPKISAIAGAIIILIGLVWYLVQAMLGRIKTVVASWIVSGTAAVLSMVTYLSSPGANLLGGALNGASASGIILILACVWTRAGIDGRKLVLNSFQKKSLLASAGITLLWIVLVATGGTGIVPNLLTQIMMIISYSMLIIRFWNAEKNTESLFTWWCVFISSVIGVVPGWYKGDWLSVVYALRSAIMSGILLAVLHRLERRTAMRAAAC